MCTHTEKTTFSCKDDHWKAIHMHGSGAKGPKAQRFVQKFKPLNNLHIDKPNTVLNFAVFIFVIDSKNWVNFSFGIKGLVRNLQCKFKERMQNFIYFYKYKVMEMIRCEK